MTEEVWVLSQELSIVRILLISICPLAFIGWFGYYRFYDGKLKGKWIGFIGRVFAAYLITLVVCGIIPGLINELSFWTQPITAFKRMTLVAFPASFSATVVDSLRKKD